jgi:hypothetical protein
LALLGLVVMCLASFSSAASAKAVLGASGGPTLENTGVTPENGAWGSTFTFTVTYTHGNGSLPAAGYPKLYLDGAGMMMEENDPADKDVTDGKVYLKSWVSAKEDIGSHNFYFCVETPSGENARSPATGAHEGPEVKKQPMSLSCEVDKPEPAAGEIITFSGYLRPAGEKLGRAGDNIILYKLVVDDNISMGSATTDENGYFTISVEAPGSEISCYRARFSGDDYYETSESPNLYSSTIDRPLVFGGYAALLMILTGAAMFLLLRGIRRAHYLMPVLLGFALGVFLLLMGAAELSILAAGAIAGYLFAKNDPKWTRHLRVGCTMGFLFATTSGLITAYLIVASPPALLGVTRSITQTEIFTLLLNSTIFFLLYCLLLVGMGAMIGGMLRKILKPGEQKSPTGSGETTSSGVEQR